MTDPEASIAPLRTCGASATNSKNSSPLTREAIHWAYRLFLGREPEDEAVIRQRLEGSGSLEALRNDFLDSLEFRNTRFIAVPPRLTGDEPPMDVETSSNDGAIQNLFRHIQETWQRLGDTEPHWSVLTQEQFRRTHIENSKEDFYATGESELARIDRTLERTGLADRDLRICLEYGCGVGRMTTWLASRFDRIVACDISASHLEVTRRHLIEHDIQNVELRRIERIADLDRLPQVDFVYSMIVLQHNPPPVIDRILVALLRSLAPGGVAIFQVPTYRLGYEFSIDRYLASRPAEGEMEMHVLPQSSVFAILRNEGCNLIEVVEDGWTGGARGEISNTFVVGRPIEAA